jgi:hypothetical protein
MSNDLASAFNHLLSIHSRTVSISRPGGAGPYEIKVTPSNYSRNLAGPEEIKIDGREFVITKGALDAVAFPVPRRGDRLVDPDMGTHVISEVRELLGFGGAILGYRVRCS